MKILAPLVRRRPESRASLEDFIEWMQFAGLNYPLGLNTTMAGEQVESIGAAFEPLANHTMKASAVVWTCMNVRMQVFSQARLLYQRLRNGRPSDLFWMQNLADLEKPWTGGTLAELLGRMITDVDLVGNAYVVADGSDYVRLRPDWVDVLYGERRHGGFDLVGYVHHDEGDRSASAPFTIHRPHELAHFAPYPDPTAAFLGMSWLSPIIRDIQGDQQAQQHKIRFYENAATPNLVVKGVPARDPVAFKKLVDAIEESHAGADNAYKTLYLTAGADATVVGADFQQLDFRNVQGSTETRIAAASGVGAVVAQFSEGMQGSSLNAGNYVAARRRFSDIPMRQAWQAACGALQTIVPTPRDARLWYDIDAIPFLQEDATDAAEIQRTKANTIRTLVDGGWEPESVKAAVLADDLTMMQHSGLTSVQLLPPGAGNPADNAD